ncbi:outer membrane protein assembly factor BamB family protein [Cellulomonas timonensis]|uniref:outer membrane protein assembly factor BamB family protein n=1 Tax=Cellulomonas timonensis TaxID=1689271 RepID=UPI0008297CF5|nr:PQQ-binding-like beta-propeller repeat protein [Cellulomonas timonensis]
MTRPHQLQPVALDEEGSGFPGGVHDDRPDAGPGSEGGNGWRRAARRGWPIAAVLVVAMALGGAQLVLDAREQGRLNRLHAVPGVLAAVDPSTLRELWSSETRSSFIGGVVVGDDLVESAASPDGTQVVQRLEGGTGAVLWSVPVTSPDPELAKAITSIGYWFAPGCQPVPDHTFVWCTVGDEYLEFDPDPTSWPEAGRTRVVVVDAATGARVGEYEPASTDSFAALGETLLICSTAADGAVSVQAWDLRSEQPVWQSPLPASSAAATDDEPEPLTQPGPAAWVGTQGDKIVVQGRRDVWILSEDGQVQQAFPLAHDRTSLTMLRDRLWSKLDYSSDLPVMSLLLADGSWTEPVAEEPVSLTVDDGSVRDLCFTSARGRLRAIDCETAAETWERPSAGSTSGLLLDGTLYTATSTQISAIDAVTGDLRWQAVRDATVSTTPDRVLSDGQSLLLLEQAPAPEGEDRSQGQIEIVALSMADGSLSWRSPLEEQGSAYDWFSMSALGDRLAITTSDGNSSTTRVYGSR